MGDVLNFMCPCCGATLPFDGASGEMTCQYCDASFKIEDVKAAQAALAGGAGESEMVWDTGEQALVQDENGQVQGYLCQTCGAEMVADNNTAATECPYCGNYTIIPQSFQGMYRPDYVIPFKINKDAAKAQLMEFTKGKKLLPDAFTRNNHIQEVSGVYVPFWLYSCHAEGTINFEGVKVKRWEDDKYKYVKKDHYSVSRSGGMDFKQIPVDGSTQMDDATMDSLEPFDMSAAVPYDAAYFSGYLANRYDVDEASSRPRANERVQNSFRDKMREAVQGYDEVTQKTEQIRLSNAKAEYAMYPVWLLSTKYDNKVYTFGINGQTGKMVGELPTDMGKYWKYFGITTLIASIIAVAGMYFLGMLESNPVMAVIGIGIGALIGFIYAQSLKSAMNNVAMQRAAKQYLQEHTVRMKNPRDIFTFTKTERTEKPQQQQAQQS